MAPFDWLGKLRSRVLLTELGNQTSVPDSVPAFAWFAKMKISNLLVKEREKIVLITASSSF